jgi:transposase
MNAKPSSPPLELFVGIDWADQRHDLWWFTNDGQRCERVESIEQQPEAIAAWVKRLQKRFPQHRILVALEQSRGPLFVALAEFKSLELYPINPNQLANYRKAMFPSGAKSDQVDARLLAEFLQHACEKNQLRPWRPSDMATRRIGSLSEMRRKLVDQRKSQVLGLTSCLKLYFPQLLQLSPRGVDHELTLAIIRRWPTLQLLQREHPRTLRRFLAEHGIRNSQQQTEFIEAERAARPITHDKAILEPQARYAQSLAQMVRVLNESIAGYDQELKQLVAEHADGKIFHSINGAGDALVPRLIMAFGSNRDHYLDAESLQCYSGIAPITKQTGKTRHVDKRIGCPKFLRQTFHEFADSARKWSSWSRAYYDMKRSQGMNHHAAIRSLAYKWIRIMYRLWKDRTTYSEEAYLARLRQAGSPVIQFLKT